MAALCDRNGGKCAGFGAYGLNAGAKTGFNLNVQLIEATASGHWPLATRVDMVPGWRLTSASYSSKWTFAASGKSGYGVRITDFHFEVTLLHVASNAVKHRFKNVVRILLDKGANVDAKDKGETVDATVDAKEKGATVDAKNNLGDNMLPITGYADVKSVLLEQVDLCDL